MAIPFYFLYCDGKDFSYSIMKKTVSKNTTLKITYAALCLALAMVLPFLTMQIPQIGKALAPMHIAIFLCGFLCGGAYGAVVGFTAPLLRSVTLGMPLLFPDAVVMAFELLAYGLFSGMFYKAFPKKIPYIYLSLVLSMICGRIVWGIVKFAISGFTNTAFPFSAFIAGAVTNALPGIILHLLLVPIIIIALRKTIK